MNDSPPQCCYFTPFTTWNKSIEWTHYFLRKYQSSDAFTPPPPFSSSTRTWSSLKYLPISCPLLSPHFIYLSLYYLTFQAAQPEIDKSNLPHQHRSSRCISENLPKFSSSSNLFNFLLPLNSRHTGAEFQYIELFISF